MFILNNYTSSVSSLTGIDHWILSREEETQETDTVVVQVLFSYVSVALESLSFLWLVWLYFDLLWVAR